MFYAKISAITWPLIKLQCNHNTSLFTHSECVLRVHKVYPGMTRESPVLEISKTEQLRSRMKPSMEKGDTVGWCPAASDGI